MPIRREHRFFYPIDWPQLSAVIRFGRAKGRCEACRRPHGRTVFHLGDGRWWDDEAASWRNGTGGFVCIEVGAADVLGEIRTTRVVLATGHRNHNTADNTPANLAAWCQRCHICTMGRSIGGDGGGPSSGARRSETCFAAPNLDPS